MYAECKYTQKRVLDKLLMLFRGHAVLAADGKSIAVSTLDHTIAMYALGNDGPILSSLKEFPYNDRDDYTPIVPIASTSDGLTLGGMARGEIPMIEGEKNKMSLMHHEETNHLIRVIAAHGHKIIVGSSNESESILKCYSSSVVVNAKSRAGDPILVTVTEALGGWNTSDGRWEVEPSHRKTWWRTTMKRSTWIWLLAMFFIIILALSADPPSGPSFEDAEKDSSETDMFKPSLKRHEYWILFGIRHFAKYLTFQCTAWLVWMLMNF
ncbi:hypothetical protein FS749_006430 [Ceratobasidium sp. UAMH 11750]|nr:hypothetical protein FS749_006430 [Ceratobasidium sp. UAMH 11750]